jgi:general secretion pathway protein G
MITFFESFDPRTEHRRRDRNQQSGMTLLEIMIVIALIGLVMGAIGVGLNAQFKKAQIRTARVATVKAEQAIGQYMMENHGNCPATLDDVVRNLNLTRQQTRDPWGRDYTFKCPGTVNPDGIDVVSAGPDRQEGTTDDIKSWESQ